MTTWQVPRRAWLVLAVEAALIAVAVLDTLPWGDDSTPSTTYRIVSVIAVVGLLVRRRFALLTWAMCIPAVVCSTVLVTPLIAVYSVARRAPRWWITAIVVAGTAAASIDAAFLQGISTAGNVAIMQTVVDAVVFAAGPAAAGLAMAARHTLRTQLDRIVDMQEHERVLLTGSAIAAERTRLAREMHDVVSHQVSLIALQAGALRMTADDPDTRSLASTIRNLATLTLDELRVMVGVLRNGQDADLAPQPRLADIARLVEASELDVDLHDDLPAGRAWSAHVERAAYRTVQEGLTNARKHAPGASVQVRLLATGQSLTVIVRDDGWQGVRAVSDTPPRAELRGGGHGLIGLRERAELLGGQLRTRRTPTGGFELTATFGHAAIPLPEAAAS